MNQRPSSGWSKYFFGILIGLLLIVWLCQVYTDYQWMDSVAQAAVFVKILGTKIGLAVVVGVIWFIWLYLNMRYARKPLPKDVTFVGRRLLPDEEREQIEQYADRGLLIIAIVAGLMAALVASGKWRDYLLFANAIDFGATDPVLHHEIGFYVFKLSFIQYVWRSLLYGVIIAFVLSTLVHLYQEAIRLVGNTVHIMPRARQHLFSLLALALFLKIYDYRLMQFNLMYSTRGEFFSGLSYADGHARFPVLFAMMGVALITGIIMLVSIRQRGFKLAGWALAGLAVTSLLAGTVYPAAIQYLVVRPNQLEVERDYAAHNIKATNDAYGLDEVEERTFPRSRPVTASDIAKNPGTIKSIRLWDHRPLEITYDQTQGLRRYYKFADVDVDRYTVNGEYRQVMLSARQLNYAQLPSQKWVNRYLTYTHGYGLCLSPVHETNKEGLPRLWVKDIPPVTTFPELQVSQPALYYMTSIRPRLIELIAPPESRPAPPDVSQPGGPQAGMQYQEPPSSMEAQQTRVEPNPYVIVNTKHPELDYPKTAEQAGQNVTTHYSGTGGVPIDNWLNRVAFAIRFKDKDILLTQYIKPGSKLQMNRYVPDRLYAIVPFPVMVFDPDPYLVVVDGKLKWICDAYTVSRMYPYSTRKPEIGNLNYIRNSVKVVVDAYTGQPTFYVVDEQDPVLRCYRKIFPTLFTDFAQMPAALRKHIRYPQLLFRVQAEVFARYHMKDVKTFYANEDEWAIPPELYSGYRRPMEAYYVIVKLPGENKAEFIQMVPMVLAGREEKNLVAWMAARSDEPHYGKVVVYKFSAAESFLGPMQFESLIDQDDYISQQFTLWGQQGSQVIRGNTLVIPIENSLLYVEPIYLVSTEAAFPVLKQVIVSSGERIVMKPTLDEALETLFGPGARVTAARQPQPTGIKPATPEMPMPTGVDIDRLAHLIRQAQKLSAEADRLRRSGDLAGYQAKNEELQKVINQLGEIVQ